MVIDKHLATWKRNIMFWNCTRDGEIPEIGNTISLLGCCTCGIHFFLLNIATNHGPPMSGSCGIHIFLFNKGTRCNASTSDFYISCFIVILFSRIRRNGKRCVKLVSLRKTQKL